MCKQGCALRKIITRSPKVPNHEFQGAQKAYMNKVGLSGHSKARGSGLRHPGTFRAQPWIYKLILGELVPLNWTFDSIFLGTFFENSLLFVLFINYFVLFFCLSKVSFTIKELREMTKLKGCKAVFDPDDFRTIQEKLPSKFKKYHQAWICNPVPRSKVWKKLGNIGLPLCTDGWWKALISSLLRMLASQISP